MFEPNIIDLDEMMALMFVHYLAYMCTMYKYKVRCWHRGVTIS